MGGLPTLPLDSRPQAPVVTHGIPDLPSLSRVAVAGMRVFPPSQRFGRVRVNCFQASLMVSEYECFEYRAKLSVLPESQVPVVGSSQHICHKPTSATACKPSYSYT